jgi:hypothetical protein
MADHVPAQSGGAQRDFRFGFLDFIFAKQREAEFRGFSDQFRRVSFGDRQQRHRIWGANCALAGSGDSLPDAFKVGS